MAEQGEAALSRLDTYGALKRREPPRRAEGLMHRSIRETDFSSLSAFAALPVGFGHSW